MYQNINEQKCFQQAERINYDRYTGTSEQYGTVVPFLSTDPAVEHQCC